MQDSERDEPARFDSEIIRDVNESAAAIARWMERAVPQQSLFSYAMVVIAAEGRDLPSLTLIDLPGLISSSRQSEAEAASVEKVRAMVMKYMQLTSTLILAVTAANLPMEEQEVLEMAKVADPSGERTLAVLTKVDLIEPGSEKMWHQFVTNRAHPIRLGWAAVKCRNQQDRDAKRTIQQGADDELRHFQKTEPWLRFQQDGILGCSSLQTRLAKLLHERILQTLPTVSDEIETKLRTAEAELAELGLALHTPDERRVEFDEKVHEVSGLIQRSSGSYGIDDFFRDGVDESEENDDDDDDDDEDYVDEDEDDSKESDEDEEDSEDEEQHNRWRAMIADRLSSFRDSIAQVSAIPAREVDASTLVVGQEVSELTESGYRRYVWTAEDVDEPKQVWHAFVFTIQQSVKRFRGRDLPGFLSFSVFAQLLHKFVVSRWIAPTRDLFEDVSGMGRDIAMRAVHATIRHPRFAAFMEQHVNGVSTHLHDSTVSELKKLELRECAPTTQDSDFFETVQILRAEALVSRISAIAANKDKMVSQAEVIAVLHEASQQSKDVHETDEMYIMLQAYTKTAMKRYVDTVEQTIMSGYVDVFGDTLKRRMKATDSELEKLFVEVESVAIHRRHVLDRISNLRAVVKRISEYRQGF